MNAMPRNKESVDKNKSLKSNSDLVNNIEQKEFNESLQAHDAVVESVGLNESAEPMGNISENATEDKSADMGSGGQTQAQSDEDNNPAKIKEKLLDNLPPIKMMKNQIEKEINKEIDYLHNKAMKMVRTPGKVNYYEYNNIIKKIRELKRILGKLLKAPLEAIKTLWLRYVHGIM